LSGCGTDEESTATASTAEVVEESTDTTDHDEGEDHDEGDDHDGDGDHADESASGLGAHEHGAADLTVAWSEGDMVVDLITPTQNIFGFEYEPTTDEDIALVAERIDALSEPGIVAINAEAGCELAGAVSTEVEYEGSHAELTASWLFSCAQPDQIKQLDAAGLFAEFPSFEDIDAQWASATGQSSAELSPSAPTLALE